MLKKLFFALVILTVAVSARRISKHRALAQDPRSDLEGASAAISSAAPLKYDAIRKIFNDNFIRIAKDQNKPVKRVIGTYESVGVRRTCSNGNCGDFSADIQYTNGAKGVVTAILNPAANGKAESIDITFNYYWPSCTTQTECMTHLTCLNVGQADTTPCEWSTYQEAYKPSAYGSGRDLYNSAPKLSKGDSKMKQNAIRITAKGLLVVREYYEDDVRSLIHTIRHIRGTYAADAFVPATAGADGDYVKQLNPDVANMFAAVKKAKVLTTEQIIRKFFTQDNIDIALMQSASTPVKKAIGAYQTGYFVKTCDSGVCGAWSQVNLVSADQFGGEGSITLSCTISDPKDLSKSKCDVSMTMKGGYGWEYQTFAVCPAVGNAVSKCNGIQSGPSYFRLKKDSSTDRTFWDRANFVRDVVEADEFYFTDSQLVARWKWHGLSKGDSYAYGRLVYSELITYSTPFSDFANSDKTNCLSKATADQILANAQQKKNLKNKIVLQKKPLEDLVKNAPYKSIDEAIVKISGIGPVNVVYVSFWYNFFC